jgi:uncharacterized membrane protein
VLPTLVLSVDALLLLACAWFALLPNRSFVQAALKGRDWGDLSAWGFGAALVLGVLACTCWCWRRCPRAGPPSRCWR